MTADTQTCLDRLEQSAGIQSELPLGVVTGIEVFQHGAQFGDHGFLPNLRDVLPTHRDPFDIGPVFLERHDAPGMTARV